jgi:Secretion system C-terminal sorting domain/SprB repeat
MKKLFFCLLVLMSLTTNAQQYTAIPDVNFETKLIELGIDSGAIDGRVLTSSVSGLLSLYISGSIDAPGNIADLTGIQDFTALTNLNCSWNKLTSLDVSKNVNLYALYCDKNELTTLNVSGSIYLNYLTCNNNELTTLDTSKNTILTRLNCGLNKMTTLDVSRNFALTSLSCGFNKLTTLDVSKNINLAIMYCGPNELTELDVSKNLALSNLNCSNNQLKTLDVSKNSALKILSCEYNQLLYRLNVKNGNNANMTLCNMLSNPNLPVIVVDDVSFANSSSNFLKDPNAIYSATVNNCDLNVTIGSTLDNPVSTFFVNTGALNGTAPYTYKLDGIPSASGATFYANTLTTGTHVVVVQDANGCIGSGTFVVQNIPPLNASSTITSLSCNGSNDGAISINATGGQAPYTYSKDGGVTFDTNRAFYNLPVGTYNVIVKDASGSTTSFSTSITEPTPINSNIIVTNQTATITISGGVQPYYSSLDGGVYIAINATTFTFVSLPLGAHTIAIRDSNGCLKAINFVVAQSDALNANFTTSAIPCNSINGGIITIDATGGQTPYQYSIDGGASYGDSKVFYNLTVGVYNSIVKDASGSIKNLSLTIAFPATLVATTATSNLTASIIASGGTPPYQYSSDGSIYKIDNTFTFTSPGNAILYVKDANGCTASSTALLFVNTPLINNKTTATVAYAIGKKLADIVIDGGGQNIKWYSSPGTTTAKIKQTSRFTVETPLDPNTIVEDGKTYYASQTINGFESAQRLAVTVSSALGTEDFILTNFQYYPNPVKNTLKISNSAIIDEVAITSAIGKTILTKAVNSLSSDIDLSGFSNGIYFLKVKSEGKEKTVKILK